MPFRKHYSGTCPDSKCGRKVSLARPELAWLLDQPETMITAAESPECYKVFTTGGAGGKSQFIFGGSDIATAVIE